MFHSFLSLLILCSAAKAQIVMETDDPELPDIVVIRGEGEIVDPDQWTPFPTPAPVVTGSPTGYPTPLSPAPTVNPYYLWDFNSHDECISNTGLNRNDCLEAALLVGRAWNFPYYLNIVDDATVPCGCSLFFNDNGDPIVNYNRNTINGQGCAANVRARLVCLLPPPTSAPSMPPTQGGGGPLRLMGGSSVNEGRVEMYYNGAWGTICDDGFDNYDGNVICNQLGFGGVSSTFPRAHFGAGTGQIVLDNLACSGSESRLLECTHNGINIHNCGHSEDAGVSCNLNNGSLRLVGGSDTHEGRVEIYYDGNWGTVCDDSFDMNDADVICNQMGYHGAEQAYQQAHFGQGSGQIVLDNLACTGSESRLLDCQHNGINNHNCGHGEDASVRCLLVEALIDGTLRLMSGSVAHEGRVEMYYDGEWGTVCDDSFGIDDANVICNQLGYNGAEYAYTQAHFGQGIGQIFLDNLHCTGSEASILSCPHNGINNHNCGHGEDAGVRCRQ